MNYNYYRNKASIAGLIDNDQISDLIKELRTRKFTASNWRICPAEIGREQLGKQSLIVAESVRNYLQRNKGYIFRDYVLYGIFLADPEPLSSSFEEWVGLGLSGWMCPSHYTSNSNKLHRADRYLDKNRMYQEGIFNVNLDEELIIKALRIDSWCKRVSRKKFSLDGCIPEADRVPPKASFGGADCIEGFHQYTRESADLHNSFEEETPRRQSDTVLYLTQESLMQRIRNEYYITGVTVEIGRKWRE